MWTRIAVIPLIGVSAFVALYVINYRAKHRVPEPEMVRRIAGPFLVEPEAIQGIYWNLDVDSIIFTYRTAADSEEEFWGALETELTGKGWTRGEPRGGLREYRRSYRKGQIDANRPDMAMFASTEVAKVALHPAGGRVAVVRAQADDGSDDATFEETSEGRVVMGDAWPRFEKILKEQGFRDE